MTQHELWFTRHGGEERGPFPVKQIHQYLLLGRFSLDDYVSQDKTSWVRISDVGTLIPAVMKLDPNEPDTQTRLDSARRAADERLAHDRRDGQPVTAEILDMRRAERRQDESVVMVEHRKAKTERIDKHKDQRNPDNYRRAAFAASLLIIGALAAVLVFVSPKDDAVEIDCTELAKPSVNWSNCDLPGLRVERARLSMAKLRNTNMVGSSLSGADMRETDLAYSNLSVSDLSGVDFRYASLVGASLRKSILRGADMRDTDMSYVDLRGADIVNVKLENATLNKAIWTDGTICALGSVGQCQPSGEKAGKITMPGRL